MLKKDTSNTKIKKYFGSQYYDLIKKILNFHNPIQDYEI